MMCDKVCLGVGVFDVFFFFKFQMKLHDIY